MSDTPRHRFDADRRHRLDRPERQAELRPEALMAHLAVEAGMVVADVGCGTGLFTRAAARAVGGSGCVYALDVQPQMIAAVKEQAPPEHVVPICCPEDRIPLPLGSVDVAILAFVLHEAIDPAQLLDEVAMVLRPRGRVACLEWEAVEESRGPPRAHRLPVHRVAALMARAGLSVTTCAQWTTAHYLIVASKDPL